VKAHFANKIFSSKAFAFNAFIGLATLFATPYLAARDTSHPTYKGFTQAPSKDEPKLSQEQSNAKYRTCPSGWYNGPQKGKVWYAKDAYLWVVTPAFAKRYCMPVEFVHEGLKGAEAVAFRILRKNDEVNCGLGGNDQNCSGELVFRVELYMDSKVKLPKLHDGRYYQVPNMPSQLLVSATQEELAKLRNLKKSHPPDALTAIFKVGQIGISGYKDGKVAWPLLALYPQTFYGQIFEGIDYYSFDGSADRSFSNPRMRPLGLTDFRIDFERLDQKPRHSMEGMPENEFAHMIHLPREFSQFMAEIDIKQGLDVQSVINEVLKK
jgi:hypothetical protein